MFDVHVRDLFVITLFVNVNILFFLFVEILLTELQRGSSSELYIHRTTRAQAVCVSRRRATKDDTAATTPRRGALGDMQR